MMPDPIVPIDPLTHVRSHPEMYCGGGQPDPAFLATRLTSDALTLGATRTINIHRGDLWAVAADIDWLATAPLPVRELFESVVAFPERAVNDFRSEILLTAFAEYVATYADGSAVNIIKGPPSPSADLDPALDRTWRRVVVFRVQSAAIEAPAGLVTASR